MVFVRWGLGVVTAAVGLALLLALLAGAVHLAGLGGWLPARLAPWIPVAEAAQPWWGPAILLAAMLFLTSAGQLMSRPSAIDAYAFGVLSVVVIWWFAARQPAWDIALGGAYALWDCYAITGLFGLGVLIWLTELRKRPRAAPEETIESRAPA